MSLQSELELLNKRVQDLKRELRRAILAALGVDLKKVFREGWDMSLEWRHSDHCNLNHPAAPLTCDCKKPRVWKNVDEAWANSDSEEL